LNDTYISPNSYLNPANYGFYTSNTYEYNTSTPPPTTNTTPTTINLGNLLYSPNQSLTLNLSNGNKYSVYMTGTNGPDSTPSYSAYRGAAGMVFPPSGCGLAAITVPDYGTGGYFFAGGQGQIVIVVTYVDTQVNSTVLTNPFN
jgi:hypothetical protein